MTEAFDVFARHLRRNNQLMTPQRRIIFQLFLEAPAHISAKEMLRRVRRVAPEIGQATVYRTMRLLAESGVAREVRFDDGIARYEFEHGRHHHDHIVCTRCRRNVDVLDPRIERLQELLADMHGFKMTSHKMILFGLCGACQEELGVPAEGTGKPAGQEAAAPSDTSA